MKFPMSMLVACLIIVMQVGCTESHDFGETGTVSGKVTVNGQPIEEGARICFMEPTNGYLAFGVTDDQGNYRVSSWNDGNLPIGNYKMMIQVGQQVDSMDAGSTVDDVPKVTPQAKITFDKKYTSFENSGLSHQVNKGENKVDINI